jgi:hypothetical protein
MRNELDERFPVYDKNDKKNGYKLSLDNDGFWNIRHMLEKRTVWKSKDKSLPYPPKNGMWRKLRESEELNLFVTPIGMVKNYTCENGHNTNSSDTTLILAITVSVSILLIGVVISVCFMCYKNKVMKEEPKIDENFYYGDDENVVSIRDHHVVDNNDYYE